MKTEYKSLYEYLGKAAGPDLGKEVAEAAIKAKVYPQRKRIDHFGYTGKVLTYPIEWLDIYFNSKTPRSKHLIG